jgi:integrase/recombinase XerD
MNKIINHGAYTDLIKQYIAYKHSLGAKMKSEEGTLQRFNRLTTGQVRRGMGISKELFDEWSVPLLGESGRNRYYRIAILRQFSSYLQMIGYDSYLPRLPKCKSTHTPHIYTKAELAALFQASDKLFQKNNQMDGQLCTLPALLRILYGTGLRLGEALQLRNRDVCLDKEYLFIRASSSKNGRDRIVPLSGSAIEVCRDFFAYKQRQMIDCGGNNYFFTALNGTKCAATTIYAHFRTALYKAGISHKGRGYGPRLHDLRHTFCVDALVQMSESGMDLYYSLPILSTYVGHQSVQATDQYVRLTAAMYPDLIQQVSNAYRYIFPAFESDDITLNESL